MHNRRALISALRKNQLAAYLKGLPESALQEINPDHWTIALDCAHFGVPSDYEILNRFNYRFHLVELVAWGDLEKVKADFGRNQGHDFLKKSFFYGDLLSYALYFKQIEVADFLKENGFNPRDDSKKYIRPATFTHDEAVLDWCSSNGVNPSAGEPIHHQAKHGRISQIKKLLEIGADPNHKDENGNTPLHLLAKRGSGKGILALLIGHGANLHLKNNEGDTPYDVAIKAGRTEFAGRLK